MAEDVRVPTQFTAGNGTGVVDREVVDGPEAAEGTRAKAFSCPRLCKYLDVRLFTPSFVFALTSDQILDPTGSQ